MNEPKTYTAADIERYHSGGLSAAERHALERAALNDPFLADALEGYAFTQTPSQDLNVLQQKLQLRIEKDKQRRSVFYLANWMKVAAMFVLFAGAGWIVFQLFNPKEKALAAKQAAPAAAPSLTTEYKTDSTTVTSDAPLTTQAPSVEPQKELEQKKKSRGNSLVVNEPRKEAAPSLPSLATAPKTDSAQANALGRAQRQGQLNEVVVATKPATDGADKKSGYVSPSTDTIRNFNVTLRRNELPASETVVLNNKAKANRSAPKMNIVVDTLEPAEGWTNFDDYIANHLKAHDERKTKNAAGEVELSFDINKEGEAVNIAVTKSLCDKCDEEAIRLLKEGPKWKKNKKKGKVKIKFPSSP